jgi:hypothetical protein
VTRDSTVKRLSPRSETVRRLFLLSGNQCAFPGCNHPIITKDGHFVGEMCHIRAAETGGERFDSTQNNEDRRDFSNLILMCHDHHVVTNNVADYPVERMCQMKADHESRFESGLSEMIGADSFQITNSTVSLGGEGGRASGAGGGGGGAIGSQSRGGRGGDGGGHFYLSDTGEKRKLDLHAPIWAKECIESTRDLADNSGAGGGGGGTAGVGSRGGDGGHGGETVVGRFFHLPDGEYQVEVGKGGEPCCPGILPGQHGSPGASSRFIAPDGKVMLETEATRRTRNASSYLPDGVRELSESDVEKGFKVVVFTACNSMELRDNLFYVDGLGWEYYDIPCVPIEAIWIVACSVQLAAANDLIGFYVALMNPLGNEMACQAISIPLGYRTSNFSIPIGALFDTEGTWKLIAHSGGYILAEYAVDVRLQQSLVGADSTGFLTE